jgi:hypothetical protein
MPITAEAEVVPACTRTGDVKLATDVGEQMVTEGEALLKVHAFGVATKNSLMDTAVEDAPGKLLIPRACIIIFNMFWC